MTTRGLTGRRRRGRRGTGPGRPRVGHDARRRTGRARGGGAGRRPERRGGRGRGRARHSRERLLRGRTLAERREQRRRALLDAALDLFGTEGYADTTIEELCRAAFVSTRNFYEEFPNRRAVLIALANEVGERIVAGFLAVEVEPGPHAEARRVQAGVAGLVRMMLDDPRLARVAFVETMRDDSLRRSVLSTFPVWLREILARLLRGERDRPGPPAGLHGRAVRCDQRAAGRLGAVPRAPAAPDVLVDHAVELDHRGAAPAPAPGGAGVSRCGPGR